MLRRNIIIGDVHGCLRELEELLDSISPTQSDHILFVGDVVDRGPHPVETVRFIKEMTESSFKVSMVRGNHEDKLCKWRFREDQFKLTGRKNKMHPPSPERMEQWNQFSDDEIEWLRSLPVMLEIPNNWLVVHAGLIPDKPLSEQDPEKIMRIRNIDPETMKSVSVDENFESPPGTVRWNSLWKGPWNVVYGHYVVGLSEPEITVYKLENGGEIKCVGIDTGCCFGGRLTGLIIHPDSTIGFTQVKAHAEYSAFRG
jgi:bis(5'-nucleosyl)-tetraphosphatase (symmetrical)